MSRYPDVQVHDPVFLSRHVFLNEDPGVNVELSGTVTSETNWARLHETGINVIGVFVGDAELTAGVLVGEAVVVGVTEVCVGG